MLFFKKKKCLTMSHNFYLHKVLFESGVPASDVNIFFSIYATDY